ncbi:AmpG family muropeptide MFS transporter [Luminiphilus sp.]|nr:AmpG family muropeptide MFS transporter [Luminiphilus sp.]MDA9711218.1 AmpG family muropeptide MFS transporter [Luminiphilus sp.]
MTAALLGTAMNRRMLICVLTGLASGMPYYILFQLVPAWLRSADVSLAMIGVLSLVGLPYFWKFLWAPFMDRITPPFGRRRGWMLLAQLGLIVSIGSLGYLDPLNQTALVAVLASLIAFLSATQDVAIDAYRREVLPDEELGLGNAIHVQAYRIAGLVPGSLSLILADVLPWVWVFWITAGFMSVGLALSLSVTEPASFSPKYQSLRETLVNPFSEYFHRAGWRTALFALLFMVAYKLGDNMATALATPFYLDLGFSMTEIGVVAKNAALWPAIAGGLLGGLVMFRLGINRALWVFGAVQLVSILGFVWLASVGAELWVLATVIAFEYFGVGLGTAAFTAFIARESSRAFAATQFALFTAFAALPRSIANASTGFIVESTGWVSFFLFCTAMAIPGMVLLIWVAPWRGVSQDRNAAGDAEHSSGELTHKSGASE